MALFWVAITALGVAALVCAFLLIAFVLVTARREAAEHAPTPTRKDQS